MLKDEIKKSIEKGTKTTKSTQANILNLWLSSWDQYYFIKTKLKNYKTLYPIDTMLNGKSREKK
jgi:hypothetical protein